MVLSDYSRASFKSLAACLSWLDGWMMAVVLSAEEMKGRWEGKVGDLSMAL